MERSREEDWVKKILNRIADENKTQLYEWIKESLKSKKPSMIVTANPEIVMWAKQKNKIYNLLIKDENVKVVADGIGIVKACKLLLNIIVQRIPGVDIVEYLLKIASDNHYTLYVYGSKEKTLESFKKIITKKYSGLELLGLRNGYDYEEDEVAFEIKRMKPDIVLVALGVPRQELFIANYMFPINKGIYIGVGGSIDSITGEVKRAPKFFIKHNIEWLYRICRQPKRLGRFYRNNVKFLIECMQNKWRYR